MTKNQVNEREQMAILTIEQLNPQDHLVRKLDAALDFSFIYPLVENLYSVEKIFYRVLKEIDPESAIIYRTSDKTVCQFLLHCHR